MTMEGGFRGRTNKLVDACYSFWQGAACALVDVHLNKNRKVFYFFFTICFFKKGVMVIVVGRK